MPRGEHILGIDEGTTGVRARVFHADGSVVGGAYREIKQIFPQPGWLEQDAEEIWRDTRDVIGKALAEAKLDPGDIAALGITNQRGTAVQFRRDGSVVGPVIAWQDGRTTDRCMELLGQGFLMLPMTAGTKYEWLHREHGRDVPAGELRLGTIDTWLAARLTDMGTHVSDHSNLSSTGCYDPTTGDYMENVVEELGLRREWLPDPVDTSAIIGQTSRKAFGAEIPVAALAGDQHAAMYAQACHRPGSIKLSLGTSGMMDVHVGPEMPAAPPGAYPLVLWALDGVRQFCIEGATITAGAAAQWLRDGLGIIGDMSELEDLARSVPDSDGVWVVPAFQGLGTPHLDIFGRAMIGGLSRGAGRGHVARALLEGVALRSAEVLETLTQGLEVPPTAIRVDGGAARNSLLLQLIADATGVRVERPARLESAVRGAAAFAARAVGLWTDDVVESHWEASAAFAPQISADERQALRERFSARVQLVQQAGS